jgi:hypothetical protein
MRNKRSFIENNNSLQQFYYHYKHYKNIQNFIRLVLFRKNIPILLINGLGKLQNIIKKINCGSSISIILINNNNTDHTKPCDMILCSYPDLTKKYY